MFKKSDRHSVKVLASLLCFALIGTQAFAKSKTKTTKVKEEDGYYYGYGKAATTEEAIAIAKKDLIETSLTSTVRLSKPEASRIHVSEDAVKNRLKNIKPFNQSKNGQDVTLRIKVADWDKEEKAYAETIRTQIADDYALLTGKGTTAQRINSAVKILEIFAANGVTDIITVQEKATELYSAKVKSICDTLLNDIEFSFNINNKIITPSEKIIFTAKDNRGTPLSGVTLKVLWALPYLPITTDFDEIEEVVSVVETDGNGQAVIDYPVSSDYQNKLTCLTVSVGFALSDYTSPLMRELNEEFSSEARFMCYNSIAEGFASVNVSAGKYTVGAVASDKRAAPKEAARDAKVGAYSIAVAPVTNYQFAAYLYLTGSEEYPEYFENSDYNYSEQPVVGVSVEAANAYANWLSEQTGAKYRLPTDDEWEIAARAGSTYIYPWGDDDPSKAKKANYRGNGKYSLPSPVGSFPESNNSWGLEDMGGNVWEWTSSARNTNDNPDLITVKGASWMDGPVELRISNFKNLNKNNGYPDVGFRLVKEN